MNIENLLMALANHNRLLLLKQIVEAKENGLIVSAAAEMIPVQRGTTSYHFNKMLDAELVEVKNSGRYRIYKVNKSAIAALRDFFAVIITNEEFNIEEDISYY